MCVVVCACAQMILSLLCAAGQLRSISNRKGNTRGTCLRGRAADVGSTVLHGNVLMNKSEMRCITKAARPQDSKTRRQSEHGGGSCKKKAREAWRGRHLKVFQDGKALVHDGVAQVVVAVGGVVKCIIHFALVSQGAAGTGPSHTDEQMSR